MNDARQLPLFPVQGHDIVNVASVPQRSPFRYPGGKTWLIPRLRQWLHSISPRPALYVEPFAGGAIAGLTVAAERLADQVLLVELDEDVAAVWQTILCDEGGADWLVDAILSFHPSHETVPQLFAQPLATVRERAFVTLVKNRVNRGGILAPGAGLIKYGENGKGMLSRWYPDTLARRIRAIERDREHITFVQGDGLSVIREQLFNVDAVFFIDPPYTASTKRAGSRLYRHFDLDHGLLFELVSKASGDFLMTYDNAGEVLALASRFGLDTRTVSMKNTHHTEMRELLIGRNLDWSQTRQQ